MFLYHSNPQVQKALHCLSPTHFYKLHFVDIPVLCSARTENQNMQHSNQMPLHWRRQSNPALDRHSMEAAILANKSQPELDPLPRLSFLPSPKLFYRLARQALQLSLQWKFCVALFLSFSESIRRKSPQALVGQNWSLFFLVAHFPFRLSLLSL